MKIKEIKERHKPFLGLYKHMSTHNKYEEKKKNKNFFLLVENLSF